ncbi:MAG: hypothetical protein ACUVR8_01970 [Acidobacteriota bacterium]
MAIYSGKIFRVCSLENASHFNGVYQDWHYIGWEGTTDWHPHILTEQHWPAIRALDALWARKFDLEKAPVCGSV